MKFKKLASFLLGLNILSGQFPTCLAWQNEAIKNIYRQKFGSILDSTTDLQVLHLYLCNLSGIKYSLPMQYKTNEIEFLESELERNYKIFQESFNLVNILNLLVDSCKLKNEFKRLDCLCNGFTPQMAETVVNEIFSVAIFPDHISPYNLTRYFWGRFATICSNHIGLNLPNDYLKQPILTLKWFNDNWESIEPFLTGKSIQIEEGE